MQQKYNQIHDNLIVKERKKERKGIPGTYIQGTAPFVMYIYKYVIG